MNGLGEHQRSPLLSGDRAEVHVACAATAAQKLAVPVPRLQDENSRRPPHIGPKKTREQVPVQASPWPFQGRSILGKRFSQAAGRQRGREPSIAPSLPNTSYAMAALRGAKA